MTGVTYLGALTSALFTQSILICNYRTAIEEDGEDVFAFEKKNRRFEYNNNARDPQKSIVRRVNYRPAFYFMSQVPQQCTMAT